jgi:[ribosomal protein S5]-alanine N-acetyltransferase
MYSLHTERLTLTPLTLENLESGLSSLVQLSDELRLPIVPTLFDGIVTRAVSMKIEKMRVAAVSDHLWFTYWLIIIKDLKIGAGMVGFKGIPNDLGEVEIGYGIEGPYRRKGYMTEAVIGLIHWAFQSPTCLAITATNVRLDNIASQHTLLHAGFTKVRTDKNGISYRFDK